VPSVGCAGSLFAFCGIGHGHYNYGFLVETQICRFKVLYLHGYQYRTDDEHLRHHILKNDEPFAAETCGLCTIVNLIFKALTGLKRLNIIAGYEPAASITITNNTPTKSIN
jgi:hypothetical protein